MNKLPKRSQKTNLSDDELIILDFLAMKIPVDIHILLRENYPVHMNCDYTHNISDDNIEKKMSDLTLRGLILQEIDDIFIQHPDIKKGKDAVYRTKGIYYRLTEKGGVLWEFERCPIWKKYCSIVETYTEPNGDSCVEIRCIDKELGLYLAKVATECGLYTFNFNKIELIKIEPCDFIYWKKFDQVWAWKVLNYELNSSSKDWKLYENKRTWWINLYELQKFLP